MEFSELVVVLLVGIVVFGPRELPKLLRTAGEWAGKARRAASQMRNESGLDDMLRGGTVGEDLRQIRALARGELDEVSRGLSLSEQQAHEREIRELEDTLLREREYPLDGVDAYGAIPDHAVLYDELPPSRWATDSLYADGVLPESPHDEASPADAPGEPARAASEHAPSPHADEVKQA